MQKGVALLDIGELVLKIEHFILRKLSAFDVNGSQLDRFYDLCFFLLQFPHLSLLLNLEFLLFTEWPPETTLGKYQ